MLGVVCGVKRTRRPVLSDRRLNILATYFVMGVKLPGVPVPSRSLLIRCARIVLAHAHL